jgi:Conserved TM helix
MISDYYNDYPSVVQNSITNLYDQVIQYVPNLIAALIVLLIGWAVGIFLGNIVKRGLQAIGVDGLGDQLGLKRLGERSGRPIHISNIVQWVIKWFFILASIIAAADILGLDTVSNFFYSDVLGYAGHVIIAMAILLLGLLAANFLSNVIEGTVRAGGFESARMLGSIARWSVTVFAIIAALSELQIAQSFLNDLFRAIVAMMAIAGGLAFGLGGQAHARKILDYIENGVGRRS